MNAPVQLAVDLGTTHTVAVIGREGQEPRSLLFDGSPLLASGVFLDAGGELHTGRDAQRLAAAEPERYEPHPKRRIDDGTVLLGDREVPVEELLATGLRRVMEEAAASGLEPDRIVLTHPADWGPVRRALLERAAALAGMRDLRLLPEPIAAATYCTEVLGREIPIGAAVAIFDFGGGTFDTAVVRRDQEGRLRTLAFGGLDDLGGLDVDMVLAAHLGRIVAGRDPGLWQRLSDPKTTADLRDRLAFWGEVRAAKEMLSRTSTAPVALPGHNPMGLHLTRDELTSLAGPLVARAVDETRRTVERAGVEPAALAALLLVGGSSRMPLVATSLHTRLGVAPSVPEQPELPVAFGALRHVIDQPEPTPPQTPPQAAYAPYPVPDRTTPMHSPLSPPGSYTASPVTDPVGAQQSPPPEPPPRAESPPQTPQVPFQPNVHTGPMPTGPPAPRRRAAISVVSTTVVAIVVAVAVATTSVDWDGLFGDFSTGDLIEGVTGSGDGGDGGDDGATEGTALDVVYEQQLTGTGASAVTASDGVAVIAEVADGKTAVTAFDRTGATLWTQNYDLEPTELGLMVVENLLIIDAAASATDGGDDMRAVASLDTGEFLWKRAWIDRNDVAFYGTDLIVEQRTGFEDNAVIRIDLTTGEQVWEKTGPYDLFIIDEYRIRAETVWDDGEEHAGTVPPNSYTLYDNLAAADRIIELDPDEGTATVRDADGGGSLTSGDLPIDSNMWTAYDGLAIGKVSDGASPGRAVLAGYSLDDLGEAWSLSFDAGYSITEVKACGEHLVCAAVENSDAEQYTTIAVDTQTGEQRWRLDSTDWSDEEHWYTASGALLHGDQVFETLDTARVVDFDGTVTIDQNASYSSVYAIKDGLAAVVEYGSGTDWQVYLLDPATGDRTPMADTGTELPQRISLAGGTAVVLTGDGRALVLQSSGLA